MAKKSAKRPNGTGSILKLKTRDPETGEVKESKFWYVLYTVGGQQRRESTGTEDYKEAKKLLDERMAENALGIRPTVEVKDVTYDDIRDAYVEHARKDGAAFQKKKDGTENLPGVPNLDAFFKGRKALEITSDLLSAYVKHRTSADIKGPTIRRELGTLRAMMRLAHKNRKLRHADLPYFDLPPDSKARKGFLTPDVFQKLLAEMPEHLRPVILFQYTTGSRIGATKKITWAMVSDDATEIELPGEITKTGEPLTLPLAGELTGLLKKQFRKPGPLFDCTNLRKHWAEACHKLGLGVKDGWRYRGLQMHDFRRSAVRNLIRAGVSETIAMSISGHKSRTVFDRYNIVDTKDQREALIKVGEYSKVQRKLGRVAAMPKRVKGRAR